jgi:hypothetical protein
MLVSGTIRACRRTRAPIVKGRGVSILLEDGVIGSVSWGNKRSGQCISRLDSEGIKVLILGKVSSSTRNRGGMLLSIRQIRSRDRKSHTPGSRTRTTAMRTIAMRATEMRGTAVRATGH